MVKLSFQLLEHFYGFLFSLQIHGIIKFYIWENLFAHCSLPYLPNSLYWFMSPKICMIIDGDKFLRDKEPQMHLHLYKL